MPQKALSKVPIVVLIGGGSKLPAIIKAAKSKKSKFKISLVISHKKSSPGIELALKNKIPAVYFNLPDYRVRVYKERKEARANYGKTLGWFISQKEYDPKLLVFAGWDLVMDKNFFNFFKCNFGNGLSAINLHPALMPYPSEKRKITLPDDTKTPVIKGEQQNVLEAVLKERLTFFGPTVHFMKLSFDTGQVINREFIRVKAGDTVDSLRKKLMPVEDRILIKSINEVIRDCIK